MCIRDRGSLAGTVGTEQGDALATVDVQVDPKERLVAVGVGIGEAADFQHRDAHQRLDALGW